MMPMMRRVPCVALAGLAGAGHAQPPVVPAAQFTLDDYAGQRVDKDGPRYSHALDPRDGGPVRDAPRAVTEAGDSGSEAGLTATLALLHGAEAKDFLEANAEQVWVQR